MNNKKEQLPFNIDLLVLSASQNAMIGIVNNLTIFDKNTNNFDNQGLFSTEIFGPVGSNERNERFGRIKLNTEVMHPLLYKHICSLKKLYSDILSSKKFAVWSEEEKDFILSDIDNGDTGYSFFLKHINDIEFDDNDSDARAFKIKLLKSYSGKDMMLKDFLVLPAGLRDYTVGEDNKPSEDESNDLYRGLLSAVNVLKNVKDADVNSKALDQIRLNIQKRLLVIYEHFFSLLKGKKKFIEGKWARRAIAHGTRNVITALPTNVNNIDSDRFMTFNETAVGLYQFMKSIGNISQHYINRYFINKIFEKNSNKAILVNKDKLTTERVELDYKLIDKWTSEEGLNSAINNMAQEDMRDLPIKVDKYYLCLVYDDGKKVEVIYNTDTMSEDMDKKYLRPITYAEMFYLSIYEIESKFPAFLTRFPVTGQGSVYPTKLYLKTTTVGRKVTFIRDGKETTLTEFISLGERYYNSLSPHMTRLENLGGDFDGKQMPIMTEM